MLWGGGGNNSLLVQQIAQAAQNLSKTPGTLGQSNIKVSKQPTINLQYKKGMIITNKTKGSSSLPIKSMEHTPLQRSRSIKTTNYTPKPPKYGS